MENKVITESKVEHVPKDLILEHVAVSGMLYVTVDKKLLYTHHFQDHVKVHIAFDSKIGQLKNSLERSISIDSPSDEQEKYSANQASSCDDEDMLIDDALTMKFGAPSNSSISSQKLEPTLEKEKSNIKRKRRTKIPAIKKTTSTSTKLSVPKKRVPSGGKSKKIFKVKLKPLSNKIKETETETQKIELDEDNSDSHEIDLDDQETQAKDDNRDTNEVVPCRYCKKTFKSRKEFSVHRKVERKQHPCPKCHRVFRYKAYLMIHMRDHDQETKSDVSNTNSETAHSDSDGKSKECEICGSAFTSLYNLKLHLMLHTSEFAYQCCVCSQQLRYARDYSRHMTRHSKSGPIECKICKITVNSRSELSKHRLTHPVHCDLCGQVFPNKTGRHFHYKTVHKDDILKCSQCDGIYPSKEALEAHLKYHRMRKKTQCPLCGLFVHRLERHLSSSHASERIDGVPIDTTVFVCDKCPKQFKNKRAFERHSKTHSEEKLYTCSECSKQFSHCGGLRRHLVTHMQEKPYVCNVCGKTCSQKWNLKVHMQIHKTDKASKVLQLQCNQCGASFSQKNALQEHVDKEHRLEQNVLQFPPQYFQMSSLNHGQFS